MAIPGAAKERGWKDIGVGGTTKERDCQDDCGKPVI